MKEHEKLNQLLDLLKTLGHSQNKIAKKINCSSGTLSSARRQGKSATKYIGPIQRIFSQEVYWDEKSQQYQLNSKESKEIKVKVFKEFPDYRNYLDKQVKRKGRVLYWLDTWIPSINSTDKNLFKNWLGCIQEEVRILILHPFSPLVAKRCQTLDMSIAEAQQQIIDNLKLITAIGEDPTYKADISVRIYDEIPGINTIILDDTIFYTNYLVTGFTSDSFTLEIKNDETNVMAVEVNKHFDTIWVEKSSQVDPDVCSILEEKVKEEKGKKNLIYNWIKDRFQKEYLLYNLDEKNKDKPFQVSIFRIKEETETFVCELVYADRKTNDPVTVEGHFDLAGDYNIIAKFHKKKFFLELLFAMKKGQEQEVVQAVYLHTDKEEQPRASIAFLISSNQIKSHYEVKPGRATELIPEPVQSYLTQKPTNILEFKKIISSWSKFSKKKPEKWHNIPTEIQIFYPERYARDPSNYENPFVNNIGSSVLSLTKTKNVNLYEAKYITAEEYELVGQARVIPLGAKFLEVQLEGKTSKNICLHIILRFTDTTRTHRSGVYNIIYSNRTLGAGILGFKSILEKEKGNLKTVVASINPIKAPKHEDIIPFLTKYNRASLETFNLTTELFQYRGTYEVYSYGRFRSDGRSSRCLTIGILKIFPFGYAEFQGEVSENEELRANGYSETARNTLYFELKNQKETGDFRRKGFLVINTQNKTPRKGRVFVGVFAGLSHRNGFPISKRVILRFISKDIDPIQVTPRKIPMYSEEWEKTELESFRRLLTGSSRNFIGFSKKKPILDMEDLYEYANEEDKFRPEIFEYALKFILKENSEKPDLEVIKWLLKKIVFHGNKDILAIVNSASTAGSKDNILRIAKKIIEKI